MVIDRQEGLELRRPVILKWLANFTSMDRSEGISIRIPYTRPAPRKSPAKDPFENEFVSAQTRRSSCKVLEADLEQPAATLKSLSTTFLCAFEERSI